MLAKPSGPNMGTCILRYTVPTTFTTISTNIICTYNAGTRLIEHTMTFDPNMFSLTGMKIIIGLIKNGNAAFTSESFEINVNARSKTSNLQVTFKEDTFASLASLTMGNAKVYGLSLYTFTIEPKNSILNGKINIKIPAQIVFQQSNIKA